MLRQYSLMSHLQKQHLIFLTILYSFKVKMRVRTEYQANHAKYYQQKVTINFVHF